MKRTYSEGASIVGIVLDTILWLGVGLILISDLKDKEK